MFALFADQAMQVGAGYVEALRRECLVAVTLFNRIQRQLDLVIVQLLVE